MSGMAGAWHQEQHFALQVVSGIMESPAAPPGANPANYVGEYFVRANVPYERWLAGALVAVRALVAAVVDSGVVAPYGSKRARSVRIEASLMSSPFAQVTLLLSANEGFSQAHEFELARGLAAICGPAGVGEPSPDDA